MKKLPGLPLPAYSKAARRLPLQSYDKASRVLPERTLFSQGDASVASPNDYSKAAPAAQDSPVPVVMQRLAKRV